MAYGYHSLRDFGWPLGVHKAPIGYEHPWVVVFPRHTAGAWTRQEARDLYRNGRIAYGNSN